MDVDAFIAGHSGEWQRLEALVRRRRRLSGVEADELVLLYQRTATHLSMVRSAAPDPVLVDRLSSLVARGRAAVTGAQVPAWRDAVRFATVAFPAAVYRSARWWVPTAVIFVLVAVAVGSWVATHEEVQASVAAPAEVRELVRPGGQFETYYSSAPAGSFAARVWTNNAWVAALSLAFGALLGIPVLFVMAQNALNVGVAGGLMAAAGRGDVFFGLILPHGLLELTAVFVAAGVGLRLGWTVIDPGARRRVDALAQEGRAAGGVAIGLAGVLLISGVIEAFVTPSPLPTWARVAVGVVAEAVFLGYVVLFGRPAVRAGEIGDVGAQDRADWAPTAG